MIFIDKSEEIKLMIEDCEKRQSKLTEWEVTFIDSISEFACITENQLATIEKIWERVTA